MKRFLDRLLLGTLAIACVMQLEPSALAGLPSDTEMCQRLLGKLTGATPIELPDAIPGQDPRFLRDRSVRVDNPDRDLLRAFLVSELKKRGLDPKIQKLSPHEYTSKDDGLDSIFSVFSREKKTPTLFNLIARIPGQGPRATRKKIIIGAHFDVVNEKSPAWKGQRPALLSKGSPLLATPGADDNGSGVIGVFALIDRFLRKPIDSDLEFVFFDGEEPSIWGSQLGSQAYMERLPEIDRSLISQVLIFDMIGVPPETLKHSYNLSAMGIGFKRLRWIENVVKNCAHSQPPVQPYIQTWDDPYFVGHLSDSRVFDRAGLKTLLFCDVMGSKALPHHYHSERDTADGIDWSYLMGIVEHAELMIRHLFDPDSRTSPGSQNSWNEKGPHQNERF